MNEERLVEITSEICKTKDTLWIMGYIFSLNETDMSLLFEKISDDKYRGMSLYEALFNFSSDYLKSKDIVVKTQSVDFVVDPFFKNKNAVDIYSSYYQNMMKGDWAIRKEEVKRRR